jgi:hypothetical protein
MPLQHQPGADDAQVFRPAAAMRPIGSHQTEVERHRIDPTDSDKRVQRETKKLAKLVSADAPATVLTRQRAKVAEARDAVLEKIALKRSTERSATLAKQRETIRLQAEREILYRLDGSLTPSITINFGPLQIVVTPEKSPDATLRGFAYHDVHAAMQIISTATNHAAGLSRHAAQKMEVIPADLPRLRRVLDDVMRRSIRAGLTSIEEIG